MTAVCINVYMILFNVYITTLACFNGYARSAALITDISCSDNLYITDISCSDNLCITDISCSDSLHITDNSYSDY